MNFNSQITRAEWNDDSGKWKVNFTKKKDGSVAQIFEEYCDVFLYATGALNGAKFA